MPGKVLFLHTMLCLWIAPLFAGPSGALDFQGRVLTYHEDYVAEVAFPTSPELDALGLGGLTATPPNDPLLTGTSARMSLDTTAVTFDANVVTLSGSGVVGAGVVGLRSQFEGLSISNLVDPSAALVGVSASYATPGGPVVSIDVLLVRFFDTVTGPGLGTRVLLREFDSSGAVQNFDFLDLSGSDEAAILSGTPFTIDLSIDPALPSPNAEGSIRVAGSSEEAVAIPLSTLPAGGTFTSARQFGQAFSNPPMTVVVDTTGFELHLEDGADRFNLDVGTNGTPSAGYAAAGKAGVWNDISSLGLHSLVRADGSVSPATLSLTALSTSGGGLPGGDPEALLGDEAVDCAAVPANWALEFAGLENGDYTVIVYAPADAATPTGDLLVEGFSSASLPGDTGLALIQGTSYESFVRPVSDGTLSIYGQDIAFQSFCIGVAGVQLERRIPAVPALGPAALGTLFLLLGVAARRLLNTRLI